MAARPGGASIEKAIRQPWGQARELAEVELYLAEAEKRTAPVRRAAGPAFADLLAAQNRLEEARSLLAAARAKEPGKLRYRLALAGLARPRGRRRRGLVTSTRPRRTWGPGLDLQLARLDTWGELGGEAAWAAVPAWLAATRQQVLAAVRGRGSVIGSQRSRSGSASHPWPASTGRELAGLHLDNIPNLMGLFDLAAQAADDADARDLIAKIRALEGERGTNWRLTQATWPSTRAPPGRDQGPEGPRGLAAEIADRRPGLVGGAVLLAEIAELEGHTDAGLSALHLAVGLGNNQPPWPAGWSACSTRTASSTRSSAWSRSSPTGAWPPAT